MGYRAKGRRQPKADSVVAPPKRVSIKGLAYKDLASLKRFLSDRGKIRARRVTGASIQQQRQIAKAIKNAREMGVIPFKSGVSR